MSDERETLYHVIVLFFVFIKLINYKIENYYQSSHLQFINWMVFTKSCFVIDDNWYLGVQIYMYIYIYNIYIYINYFAEKKPFQDDRRFFLKVSFFIITYRIVSFLILFCMYRKEVKRYRMLFWNHCRRVNCVLKVIQNVFRLMEDLLSNVQVKIIPIKVFRVWRKTFLLIHCIFIKVYRYLLIFESHKLNKHMITYFRNLRIKLVIRQKNILADQDLKTHFLIHLILFCAKFVIS